MKMFKGITGLLLLTLLALACGGKEQKTATNNTAATATKPGEVSIDKITGPLDGNWVIKRAEGAMSETNLGTMYQFKGDRLSFGKDGFLNPGKTIVTDTSFSFQAEGNEYVFLYNYHFNGDTMVVTMQKGSGQVFHLVRE